MSHFKFLPTHAAGLVAHPCGLGKKVNRYSDIYVDAHAVAARLVSTVMMQIAALRSRLEKQPTDPATAGRNPRDLGDGSNAVLRTIEDETEVYF